MPDDRGMAFRLYLLCMMSIHLGQLLEDGINRLTYRHRQCEVPCTFSLMTVLYLADDLAMVIKSVGS